MIHNFKKFFANNALERLLVFFTRNQKLDKLFWGKLLILITPDETFYKTPSLRKATRNEVNFQLDLSQRTENGIFFGFQERAFYELYSLAKQATTIIDVGANILNSSLFMAQNNPLAIIHAFEPDPATFDKAKDNLKLNPHLSNQITLYNRALGAKTETLNLYRVNPHNSGMNRILDGIDQDNTDFVQVEVETLDSFCLRTAISKVDLIKIDVEGFELNVLKGASHIISEQRPTIFLELDNDNLRLQHSTAKETVQFLLNLNYEIHRADNGEKISEDYFFESCHFDIICRPK